MSRDIDADLVELPGGIYDIQIYFDGDIKTKDSFDAYIIVALLSDARADESEVPRPELRRGWIVNEHTPDFELGSKVWLYEQRRLTRATINGLQDVAQDALQSMVDEGLAVSIRSVEAVVTTTGVSLVIEILRDNDQVEKRHFDLWQNTGVS